MNEEFISVFVKGVMSYLDHIPGIDVEVGSPYLVNNDKPIAYDVTGIIGVSGEQKGCVYFTAPRVFLSHILRLLGDNNLSRENLLDMCGEIANTISGNARSTFGKNFLISVPVVVEGSLSGVHLPDGVRSFAIPISWRSYTPLLIVSL